MKGVATSKKTLALALGTVLLALLAVAPAAYAAPIKCWWIQIKDQTGMPLAGKTVFVVVWNETGNYIQAYFSGTTDQDGKVTLAVPYTIDTAETYAGRYNITIIIKEYDRWQLLYTAKDIDWTTFNQTYINKTITADHWWSLKFKAVTDPDGDGNFDEV